MTSPRVGRYTLGARLYDVVSGERPVYRVGRVTAIDQLRLQPGQRVLDIGCGTGLNLPLLRAQVGPGGHVTGLDASEWMLAQAHRRVDAAGWHNVDLVRGDAGDLAALVGEPPYDAVICTYALSIIDAWDDAWSQAMDVLRPGGRAALVDLAMPTGRGIVWWPLARLACWTGGSDPYREPWRRAQDELDDTSTRTHRAGHVVVVTGSKKAA